MKLRVPMAVLSTGVLILSFLVPDLLWAQMPAAISGTVTSASGGVVANAKVSIRNTATGQAAATRTNPAGVYDVPNLPPGGYALSVSANGFETRTAVTTLTGANGQTLNVTLNAASATQASPTASKSPSASSANLPSAPPSHQNGLTLQSLGFSASQTQGSTREQALLNKQVHMLKIHQRLGLITAIPMMAALITGPQAKAKGRNGQTITEPTPANLDFHMALGSLTTALYWTTASYALFAPKIPGVKPKGAIRLHRDLAWIHAPGMILTPILGIMAYRQENAGEKVHGIASAHGAVAVVTAAAYGASIVAISWPIHWKFWEKQ